MSSFANVRQVMLKQKRASKCPLLNKFIRESVAELKGNFITTHEIFEEYRNIVALWTDDDSVTGQTKYLVKQNSFNRQFRKAILAHGRSKRWDVKPKSNRTVRGYEGIKLQRARRQRPGYEFGGRLMMEDIDRYTSLNPAPVPPIELHAVPSDPRNAGICAFASRDIERGEVVVEYEGEKIDIQEAKTRETIYQREGKTCTMMIIESAGHQVAIDPYSGNIEGKTTWAARINHSRRNANLKPFVVNRSHSPRVFLIAIHDIPETTEFLWNYNDSSWELHSNSQTLPE